MKTSLHVCILALLSVCESAIASEPIKCYEKAWESREKGGLGLAAGQAVTLCGGTTDAVKTIDCYMKA